MKGHTRESTRQVSAVTGANTTAAATNATAVVLFGVRRPREQQIPERVEGGRREREHEGEERHRKRTVRF